MQKRNNDNHKFNKFRKYESIENDSSRYGVAVSGMNIYNSQKEGEMSDVLLANVDALANNEIGNREDCDPIDDMCSMLVIYPDNHYGEDIIIGMKKKPGWL